MYHGYDMVFTSYGIVFINSTLYLYGFPRMSWVVLVPVNMYQVYTTYVVYSSSKQEAGRMDIGCSNAANRTRNEKYAGWIEEGAASRMHDPRGNIRMQQHYIIPVHSNQDAAGRTPQEAAMQFHGAAVLLLQDANTAAA